MCITVAVAYDLCRPNTLRWVIQKGHQHEQAKNHRTADNAKLNSRGIRGDDGGYTYTGTNRTEILLNADSREDAV